VDSEQAYVSDVVEQDAPLASITWRELAVVGLGGALGVGLRYLVTQSLPDGLQSHGAVGIFTPLLYINTAGAFLLGLFLPLFGHAGRHHLRLGVTTGVIGGFTSYGALADLTRQQILEHVSSGRVLVDLSVSLLFGILAVTLGHFLGARHIGRLDP